MVTVLPTTEESGVKAKTSTDQGLADVTVSAIWPPVGKKCGSHRSKEEQRNDAT
jgi:hypothetical protein